MNKIYLIRELKKLSCGIVGELQEINSSWALKTQMTAQEYCDAINALNSLQLKVIKYVNKLREDIDNDFFKE